MNIYIFLLVPVLMGAILILFFRKHVIWWELAIPMVYTIVFIVVAKFLAIESLTHDIEWLGGYVTEARYYEPWNERVSCRHPIYCTRSCGKNCTTTYICGYMHAYDVDYHPEYWEVITTLRTFEISQTKYNNLVRQFKSTPKFYDMHRNYHDIDGDMYHSDWRGDDEGLEPVVVTESYENRPKAALNVFHYDPVDTFEIKTYKPFDYPPIMEIFHQQCLLGIQDVKAHKELQILNSRLGSPMQIRVFIAIFKNLPREAGFVQERYWQGSNKNEFVLCIGINDSNEVKWAYDFSWTDKQDIKIESRKFVEDQKTLDLTKIVHYLNDEIIMKWKRKDFKDFDYLTIEPTIGQSITILILILITNGLIGWWIVVNEIE